MGTEKEIKETVDEWLVAATKLIDIWPLDFAGLIENARWWISGDDDSCTRGLDALLCEAGLDLPLGEGVTNSSIFLNCLVKYGHEGELTVLLKTEKEFYSYARTIWGDWEDDDYTDCEENDYIDCGDDDCTD